MASISPIPFFEVATLAELAAQIEAGAASEYDLVLLGAGLQAWEVDDKDLYEAIDSRMHRTLAKLLLHPGRQHHLHQVKFRLDLLGRIFRFGPRPKIRRSKGAGRSSLLAKDPGETPASTDPRRRYEIIREIGDGGFATIYLAKDTWEGREVAIKALGEYWTRDPESVSAFRQEFEILNQLNHPNIVRVFSFDDLVGLAHSSIVIVMEYIDGQSLAGRIGQRGGLPWSEAKGILLQLASALAYLHDNKIVYRDFKPDHVLISGESVKIIDFGLAVFYPTYKVRGSIYGTAWYMAPEQIRGGPVTPSFDIYAFGVSMYATLAGRVPFDAETVWEAARMHLEDSPRPPRQLNRDIPECAEAIILKALAKNPKDRFQTMTELAQAMEACP